MILNNRGQTLLELIVVISVAIFVVAALAFSTVSSLRNAQLAKNQAQATKLAQEAIEKVRSGRDRNLNFGSFTLASNTITNWSDPNLWSTNISSTFACSPHCYFNVDGNGALLYIGTNRSGAETILNYGGNLTAFTRSVELLDSSSSCAISGGSAACYSVEKTAVAIVTWTDFSGSRESRLTTVLRKL